MNIMKRINILKVALMMALGFSAGVSCTDWLDVKPREMEEADRLFSTQDGFKEALAGCYTNLCQTSVYGREMTYGLVSVLGQEWSKGQNMETNTASVYAQAQRYQYEVSVVTSCIDKFWSVLYNTVAQANTLIYYTDAKRDVLNDLNYGVIRGEAFALRAFAHSEIFRLYADVRGMAPDDNHIALPYIKSTVPGITPQSTNKQFYDCIMNDIAEALKLLAVDPIISGEDMSGVDNGYLANRQYHLNYYAVLGLKARMCLYYGKKQDALQAAQAVLTARTEKGLFPWVTLNEANNANENLRDRTFSPEHLFALNIPALETYIKGYFRETDKPLQPRLDMTSLMHSGDMRARFFEAYSGVSSVYSRFWQMPYQTSDGAITGPKRDRMPLMRITEMYYIAAECLIPTDKAQAISLLQQVRTGRNVVDVLASDMTGEMIQAEILSEYQREFLGEGQLFFYHKRRNTAVIFSNPADYILPLPNDEWDMGNRTPVKQ